MVIYLATIVAGSTHDAFCDKALSRARLARRPPRSWSPRRRAAGRRLGVGRRACTDAADSSF